MSSIACNKCNELCAFYDTLLWQCTACDAQIENKIVDELMSQAMEKLCNSGKIFYMLENCELNFSTNRLYNLFSIFQIDSIDEIDRFISKFSKLFNPQHWIVIDAKQRYVSLLRERGNLKLKTLLKKESYINDVIGIVKIVEPNLSRIYGITMYEKYRTLFDLAQLEYETEIIKETDFNVRLFFLHNMKIRSSKLHLKLFNFRKNFPDVKQY